LAEAPGSVACGERILGSAFLGAERRIIMPAIMANSPPRTLEGQGDSIMSTDDGQTEQVEALLTTPHLADALESEQFRHFLDQVPIAIAVSEMKAEERIVYANPEFEKVSGLSSAELEGKAWSFLRGQGDGDQSERELGAAIVDSSDFVGTFRIGPAGQEQTVVDAYSNIIVDDNDVPAFRLAALVDVTAHGQAHREEFEQKIRDKDTLLQEVQHRVKNNLQMITALIRIETRNSRGKLESAPFYRLAGRIDAVQRIYKLLSEQESRDEIDLGAYLSEIASSVMHSHAVEGIRLDLKVDSYPVSVNVAMPAGLVVNELLTNALKHAFPGRDGGTITLHSLVEGDICRVVVADDGVGFPAGVSWPQHGKLSALIVRSLRENAKADLKVESVPEKGTRITITFKRSTAAALAAS
jgi:PAS domain S-box-containing protein